jgi:putative transcriptional regulator
MSGGGTITNRLRRLRFDAGEMTQQALADEVGVTRQTILAIEAAKYAPSLELAFRIAHAFGEPLEAVFQYEPPPASRRR